MSKYPVYQVKIRHSGQGDFKWEQQEVELETDGNTHLNDMVYILRKVLQAYNPLAEEMRVNEKGSLQGNYFPVWPM